MVNTAIDRGEQVVDPRLRPIAAATAAALLHDSGWRLLRNPLPVAGLVVAAVVILIGHWWLLPLELVIVLGALLLSERQARRLRPQWARAIEMNKSKH